MSRNYTVQTKILRPVADVFEAIVSSDRLKHYFVNGASGDLVEDERVAWQWDHYGENTIVVRKIIKNELIELALDSKEWKKTQSEAYEVLVIFEFEELEDGTMLSISEQGWKAGRLMQTVSRGRMTTVAVGPTWQCVSKRISNTGSICANRLQSTTTKLQANSYANSLIGLFILMRSPVGFSTGDHSSRLPDDRTCLHSV